MSFPGAEAVRRQAISPTTVSKLDMRQQALITISLYDLHKDFFQTGGHKIDETWLLRQAADPFLDGDVISPDIITENISATTGRFDQPEQVFMVIVLPVPLSPRKPKIECCFTVRLRPFGASTAFFRPCSDCEFQ